MHLSICFFSSDSARTCSISSFLGITLLFSFDCKVRYFFSNIRCTSMTCTIVKSVKKIKVFYTLGAVFFPSCQNAGQKTTLGIRSTFSNPFFLRPPYYQYFIPFFSRCLYINVEMNRHGSSFGSNNCSKRVVISVFIHFFSCGFGRV